MDSLEVEIIKAIDNTSSKMDAETISGFEKATEEFDRMVESGILKRRGYTLATINDVSSVFSYNMRINER